MAKMRTGFHCLFFRHGPAPGQQHDFPPEWLKSPPDKLTQALDRQPNQVARQEFKNKVGDIVDDGFCDPIRAVILAKVEEDRTLTIHRAFLCHEGSSGEAFLPLFPEPELLLALCDCGSFGTQEFRSATCNLVPTEQPL